MHPDGSKRTDSVQSGERGGGESTRGCFLVSGFRIWVGSGPMY